MFYVYLLKSLVDGDYYIGQTDNIVNRVKIHNSGKVKSTKNRLPFMLIGYETYETRNESRRREYSLKKNYSIKQKFVTEMFKKAV